MNVRQDNVFNKLLEAESDGIMINHNRRINYINKMYSIYEGDQEWLVNSDLDYRPTVKVTNLIKKLIDKKARFMMGREPYINILPVRDLSTDEEAEIKEDYLNRVLADNKWHSKLLKAKKDCSIGGKVAIKLWAGEEGIKIIFTPAQEFIAYHSIDDVDQVEKVIFFYYLNNESDKQEQRLRKQKWELVNGRCILNQGLYNGAGELLEVEYEDYYNGLDFIPVIIIQNGGLTGETEGKSDVEVLWSNQDQYNKLTSDDIDSLKFQMFGETVITDASLETIESIVSAPGAIIDLQTDLTQANQGRQADIKRLENTFAYHDKFESTIRRIKSDMYDLVDVPDTSLEQLKGMMASGKSMEAVYWDLMATCDEEWTEWAPALKQMTDYIFKIAKTYKLAELPEVETTVNIERYYPISKDEQTERRLDLDEVLAGTRSKYSYIQKWNETENIDDEIEKILNDKRDENSLSYEGGF